MPTQPGAAIEGASAPDALAIPADVLAQLHEDAKGNVDPTAVQRLQAALGTNEQSVKAKIRGDALIALKAAGHSNRQIAKLLGLKENTVKVAIWRARSSGRLNDLRDILENDTSALAVDTVNFHLRKKNPDVAIEHLKGMGFYKNHSNVKNEGGHGFTMPPLTVNVVVQNAVGAAPVTPATFDVSEMSVGTPREDAAP